MRYEINTEKTLAENQSNYNTSAQISYVFII
jgi:hypothetical protein